MTSIAQSARTTAGKGSNSTLLKGPTRGGFVGLLNLAVAWLAAQIAFGTGARRDRGPVRRCGVRGRAA